VGVWTQLDASIDLQVIKLQKEGGARKYMGGTPEKFKSKRECSGEKKHGRVHPKWEIGSFVLGKIPSDG